jgi:hypothetical protein
MSDTPKTDAFFRPPFLRYPAANFCRKFERENKELLEALEELEALGSLELPQRRNAALLKAKAAIAKAKGETK